MPPRCGRRKGGARLRLPFIQAQARKACAESRPPTRRLIEQRGGRPSAEEKLMTRRLLRLVGVAALVAGGVSGVLVRADSTPQTLPFSQDWSNTTMITVNDNWTGVPGIIGYRGDGLTGAT